MPMLTSCDRDGWGEIPHSFSFFALSILWAPFPTLPFWVSALSPNIKFVCGPLFHAWFDLFFFLSFSLFFLFHPFPFPPFVVFKWGELLPISRFPSSFFSLPRSLGNPQNFLFSDLWEAHVGAKLARDRAAAFGLACSSPLVFSFSLFLLVDPDFFFPPVPRVLFRLSP